MRLKRRKYVLMSGFALLVMMIGAFSFKSYPTEVGEKKTAEFEKYVESIAGTDIQL